MPRCRAISLLLAAPALVLAACETSLAPIDVVEGCPAQPLRGPNRWAAEPGDRLVDDFEDEDLSLTAVSGRNGRWILGTDGSSNVPTTEASSRCAARGKVAGHFAGAGFTTWGSNWTAVFRDNGSGLAVPYDARGYRSISFWAATGGAVKAPLEMLVGVTTTDVAWNGGICTTCMDFYKTTIVLESSWQRFQIPFEQLRQTGWGVPQVSMRRDQMVGFVIWPLSDFDVWVDDVRFEP